MSAWTEDRVMRLKRLWAQGLSARQVSADLGGGLTRNAVLAKVWRLGLSDGRVRGESRTGRLRVTASNLAPGLDPAPATPPSPGLDAVSVLSVRRTDCRWPYGDPGLPGFVLCGSPVSRGAYCAAHADLAYRRSPQGVERLKRWVEEAARSCC